MAGFDLSKIDGAIAGLKKDLGADVEIKVNEVTNIPRVKCKSPTIGYIFGGGGTPIGKIIELYGPESSGKTLIAQNILADFQREGKFVAFVDAEFSFDSKWAQIQGLDVSPEKFRLFQPNCGEDAFTIVVKLAESGQVGCIAVDSIASLVPKAELEGEMTDQQMGLQARVVGKGLRKIAGICSKNDTTVIFTNQIRQKIGVMFGNPECVTPETVITVNDECMTMDELFESVDLEYESLEKNKVYDISKYNLLITSYNIDTNKVENKPLLSLVRKGDSKVFELYNSNTTFLRCTASHRVYDSQKKEYVHVGDVSEGYLLTEFEGEKKFFVRETDEISPILDLQVQDNKNYFTNGILSHNTTPGGNALKFWSSIRCEVRKGKLEAGEDKEKDDSIGIGARIRNVKNKTSVPFRRGEIFISFTDGVDTDSEYINFATSLGIIERKGAWYTIPNGERAQGSVKLKELLLQNPDVFDSIKEQVENHLAGNPIEDIKLEERLTLEEE